MINRTGFALRLIALLPSLFVFGCGLVQPRPAWEEKPPLPVENNIVVSEDFHRFALPNGVQLILLEDHRLPRVTLGITLRRGAGSVDPAIAGVAQLATEVMQRGAGARDALLLAKVVEDAGASLTVSGDWDTTTVSLSGLSEDQALLLEILWDVALRPRFDEAEFDKARAEQLASIVAGQDDPAKLIQRQALRALYQGHRYGDPLHGTAETVGRIEVAMVEAYWRDRLVPENVIFWAAGDLSTESLIPELRRVLEEIPDGPQIPNIPPVPEQTPAARRIIVVDKSDLLQARIVVAHEGIMRAEPTRLAADLMNDVLGGSGFSSRLMKKIRSDEGLTYGVRSGFALRSQPGPFRVSTFTRVPKVRRVIDLILEEMRAIQEDRPIKEEELRKFIRYNVGRFGLSLETSDAVLSSLVNLEVHGLPPTLLDTYRDRVRRISIADLNRAAVRRLHPDRAAIIVLGPAELLVPELEGLGPVEVWQP
jgi:predicted Zn-dependent peptidase